MRMWSNYLAEKAYYEEIRMISRCWDAKSANHRSLEEFNKLNEEIATVLTAVLMLAGARIALARSHLLWTSGPKLAHENKKARGSRGLNLVRL